MARLKTVYKCQECGFEGLKWSGQCSDCGRWNTLVEEAVEAGRAARTGGRSLAALSSEVVRASELKVHSDGLRHPTGIGEFDRLLGGGLVEAQVLLLGGEPGVGKSTLMLQIASRFSRVGKVLYVSGEESIEQIAQRAVRLGCEAGKLFFLSETRLERIVEVMREVSPKWIVLDSIQTVYREELPNAPGSVTQVRECAGELLRLAKSSGIGIFLLGHVTKEGDLAGPRVLEHLVDTVLYFESESQHSLRVLRVYKNRFGPTQEVGLFEMQERGLKEVLNASSFFLQERSTNPLSGSCISASLEGSRPLLVDIQALVSRSPYGIPRRMATGLDLNRVLILVAVLERRLRLRLEGHDLFVSVAGGIRLKEPALDLAVCAALLSALKDAPWDAQWMFLGEVGLSGEIRRVPRLAERLMEAEKLGFRKAFIPARSFSELRREGWKIERAPLEHLSEILSQLHSGPVSSPSEGIRT